MSYGSALLAELADDRSLLAISALLVTAVLVNFLAPGERRRVRSMAILVGLHLVLVLVAAGLRTRGVGVVGYRETRLAGLIFETLALVGMGGTLLFDVVLPRVRLRTPRILRDVIAAVVSIVAIIALANRAGFPLSGLITTSAILTAVIAFSLQDTLGNIMGGLALQMDNSVQVGDWVKIGDVSGRVSEIRWRHTSIETRNWETVIIPNSVLMKGQVTVVGRRAGEPLQWRRWVYFNIDFRYQPTDVIRVVTDALTGVSIPHVAASPRPHCILIDLHDSYARYAARYWLTDIGVDDPTDSEIRTRVFFALRRAGIPLSIPAHALFVTEESTERKQAKTRADHARRLGALRQVDLFEHLDDGDRERLADRLHYAPFAPGEAMTRQGAEAHHLYMMVEGEAAVRVAVDGVEKDVARLRDGQFFGEMSLLTGERRSATVVAVTDVECYRLDKAAFQEVLQARPELAERVAEILAKRRVELSAVKENLDATARERRLAAAKNDLLGRIRDFFALDRTDGRRAASR